MRAFAFAIVAVGFGCLQGCADVPDPTRADPARADPARADPARADPAILRSLHPSFADRTDDVLLVMVKENPGLILYKDDSDCTALHYASRYGRVETAKWLIENKADVNTESYNKFTPMHMAADGATARLLIKSGADLDRIDAWGDTPLHKAAEENRQEIVDAILASNPKVDLRTAVMLGKRDLIKKVLNDDPTAARRPTDGAGLWGAKTPLGVAAGRKDRELVQLLLDAGADVNEGTINPNAGGGATALTNAVWAGDKDVVKLLLDRGAKTDVVGGKFYPTILDYARKHSAPEIVELLEKAGAKGSDSQNQ